MYKVYVYVYRHSNPCYSCGYSLVEPTLADAYKRATSIVSDCEALQRGYIVHVTDLKDKIYSTYVSRNAC